MDPEPLRPADVAAYADAVVDALRIDPADDFGAFVETVGVERFRVVRDGGRLLAGAGSIASRQAYGGRLVPSALVTAVWAAPEARGRGVASGLLRSLLAELAGEGFPITALYPANLPLYRGLDYEVAAHNQHHTVALAAIEARRPDGWSVEARSGATPDAPGPLAELYAAARPQLAPGSVDRPAALWHSLLRWTGGGRSTAFLARSPAGEARGYLVLDTAHSDPVVRVRELLALEPAATAALLGHLAGYRGIFTGARWPGGPFDLVTAALRNKPSETHADPMMLRVLDPVAALRARGWPVGLAGRFALDVEGAGPLTAVLDGSGAAEVEPGGAGTVVIAPRGLAALFTGFAAPRALMAAGLLRAADPGELDLLGAAFAGPAPWIVDRF